MGEDDDALWRKVTEGVKPLKKREAGGRAAPERDATKDKPANRIRRPAAGRLTQPGPPPKPPARPAPTALAHGQVSGVDKRSAERLKRGKLPIDGRIDLHGLTQAEAQRALSAFLDASQARKRRCVLVITGKGSPDKESGVLRQKVPQWLNLPGLREKVLAYDYAQPRDGGQGALYILLRRSKTDS